MNDSPQNTKPLRYAKGGAVLVLLIIIGSVIYFSQFSSKPTFRIEPAELSLRQGVPVQLSAFFDPDGPRGASPEADVSDNTEWSTDKQDVGYIGNLGPTKGLLTVPHKGNITITAKYQTYIINLKGTVQENPAEITCYPIRKNKAEINEPIDYIVSFSRIGVPNYIYQWTAPEGQTSALPNPYFSFQTAGEKIVKVVVTDQAGTVVSADCQPLIITK